MHTRLWTAKESVMKFFGKGLSLGAENISLYTEDCRPVAAVCSGKKLHLWNTSHEDYEITICSEQNVFPDDINFMSLDKLV
ncbi:MAG: 4-phosphopantetheinyl transferase family protein [Oscillospiraceae bacterium]|nr:4-phosphopantetheinyl transferase family protein [Oscillospiraceae bacterium]